MMKYLNAVMAVLGVFAALACLTVPFSGCASKESELEKGTSAFLKVDDYENALKLVEGFILENPEKPIGHAMLARGTCCKWANRESTQSILSVLSSWVKHSLKSCYLNYCLVVLSTMIAGRYGRMLPLC